MMQDLPTHLPEEKPGARPGLLISSPQNIPGISIATRTR